MSADSLPQRPSQSTVDVDSVRCTRCNTSFNVSRDLRAATCPNCNRTFRLVNFDLDALFGAARCPVPATRFVGGKPQASNAVAANVGSAAPPQMSQEPDGSCSQTVTDVPSPAAVVLTPAERAARDQRKRTRLLESRARAREDLAASRQQ